MEKTNYIEFLKNLRKDAIEEGQKHYFIFNELMNKIDAIDRHIAIRNNQYNFNPMNSADACKLYYENPLRVLQNNTSSLNLKNNPYANGYCYPINSCSNPFPSNSFAASNHPNYNDLKLAEGYLNANGFDGISVDQQMVSPNNQIPQMSLEEYKKKYCSVPDDMHKAISESGLKKHLDELKEECESQNTSVENTTPIGQPIPLNDDNPVEPEDKDSLEHKVHDLLKRVINLETYVEDHRKEHVNIVYDQIDNIIDRDIKRDEKINDLLRHTAILKNTIENHRREHDNGIQNCQIKELMNDHGNLANRCQSLFKRVSNLENDLSKHVGDTEDAINSMENNFGGNDAVFKERIDKLENEVDNINAKLTFNDQVSKLDFS